MGNEVQARGEGAIARHAGLRALDEAKPEPHGHGLTHCQNCGVRLSGPYCHQCGQSGHVHRTLGHVLEEFVHGVLHVDGKLWRTIPMLAFRPGRLTREYVHGKRVRYIAPLALYLFMVLLTFLVFGFTGDRLIGPPETPTVEEARAAVRSAETELAASQNDAAATDVDRAALRTAVTVTRANLQRVERAAATGKGVSWTEQVKSAHQRGTLKVNTGDAAFDGQVRKALEDPDFFLYKVQQKAYKLSFLLVPLSLPFVWLVFAGRGGVTLYDHSVFILYSVSFMLLFVCFIMLFSAATRDAAEGLVGMLFVAVPPVHVYAQLKGGYGLSVRGALWRTGLMLLAAVVVLCLYFLLLLALGVLE